METQRTIEWPDADAALVARWRIEVLKWRDAAFDGIMPDESVRVALAAGLEAEAGPATAVDWFTVADRIIGLVG